MDILARDSRNGNYRDCSLLLSLKGTLNRLGRIPTRLVRFYFQVIPRLALQAPKLRPTQKDNGIRCQGDNVALIVSRARFLGLPHRSMEVVVLVYARRVASLTVN